jgi:transcriptional regulator with XRE-family HTH domain
MADMKFAKKLQQLRDNARLSQADLAKRAGMNVFGVAKLEQGVRQPTWATVQAIAKVLGVTCEAFTDCDDVQADDEQKPAPGPAVRRGRKSPGKKKAK